ncbi:MAG: GNAT family N-acetyltransferase [Clostridiales bacterium]|jgi:GNAT superfamily N-acetyltransferase|nr:GNAT family N-acetyltransferase [Clostridiales bacterium]
MEELTATVKNALLALGADIVGFGDISELPPSVREGLPVGISIAVKYPKAVIRGISELPTREYREWYDRLNRRLDMIASQGAELLVGRGCRAIAQTRARVGAGETEYSTVLPHKTVATRAGIGWIGKCALLVTKQYGSMVRLSSILTDAPLDLAEPTNKSLCGDCRACASACPAGAVSGKLWEAGLYRDEFFDPIKCRKTARERAMKGFGGEGSICGKCIEACPHTRGYLDGGGAPDEAALRPVGPADVPDAVDMAWRVFSEFEAPCYAQEGIDEFRRFLDGLPQNAELQMTGCWKDSALIGLIAVRPPCHIALLFVDKAHHRQGIARLLWKSVLAAEAFAGGHGAATVNSSPYAVEIYKRLGFVPTSEEQTVNGMRFVPMRFEFG